MKRKSVWTFLFLGGVILMAAGCILVSGDLGKALVILGILGAGGSILGSSLDYRRRPCLCPRCGGELRPAGRWLPGAGFNGSGTVPCPHCGAVVPLEELRRK